MPFEIDPEAIAETNSVEHQDFAVPDYSGLSDVVFPYPENKVRVINDPDLRRTYIDALLDLHHLVDEYRFESLLALTILRDYVLKRDRGEVPAPDPQDRQFEALGMPVAVLAVLRSYSREPPSPSELFRDPHQEMAGNRVLSRWFAAQLIDSALYRGIAACDRLAILLRCEAELPVARTRAGERRQPSFSKRELGELDSAYTDFAHWPELRDLPVDELFEFVKQERNGFTHERRRPSELHGESRVVYGKGAEAETVPGIDASTHYAFAPAFYNTVLLPAIDLTRRAVLSAASPESALD